MATILVVDDEIGIRELLSEILGDEGHVVELAENAQQARELRAAHTPDLVLLDIWMPDTDGVTLLKEWSSQGMLTMPVIMMSGHATIDTAVEATRIGALNFLEKPIALQKLLKSVQSALARTPAAPAAPAARPLPMSSMTPMSAMAPRPATPAPAAMPVYAAPGAAASQPSGGGDAPAGITNGLLQSEAQLLTPTAPPPPVLSLQASFDMPLRDARDLFERSYFEYHLARENGSMTRVSERSGLERTHLYRKLKQLGVDLSRGRHEHNDDHGG